MQEREKRAIERAVEESAFIGAGVTAYAQAAYRAEPDSLRRHPLFQLLWKL